MLVAGFLDRENESLPANDTLYSLRMLSLYEPLELQCRQACAPVVRCGATASCGGSTSTQCAPSAASTCCSPSCVSVHLSHHRAHTCSPCTGLRSARGGCVAASGHRSPLHAWNGACVRFPGPYWDSPIFANVWHGGFVPFMLGATEALHQCTEQEEMFSSGD